MFQPFSSNTKATIFSTAKVSAFGDRTFWKDLILATVPVLIGSVAPLVVNHLLEGSKEQQNEQKKKNEGTNV